MPVRTPLIGPDLRQWGRQLNLFLNTNLGRLFFKTDEDNPSENEDSNSSSDKTPLLLSLKPLPGQPKPPKPPPGIIPPDH